MEISYLCGCRPLSKRFLTSWPSDRVRSCVRPLFAAVPRAAGRYGDLRIRSKSSVRAVMPGSTNWFSCFRSVRSLRPFRSLPSHPPCCRCQSFCCCMWIMRPRPTSDLDNLSVSSTSPRSRVPSCWPKRSPRASSVFAPTNVPAMNPRGSIDAPSSSIVTSPQ